VAAKGPEVDATAVRWPHTAATTPSDPIDPDGVAVSIPASAEDPEVQRKRLGAHVLGRQAGPADSALT
jgi:hypothetical protein